jgi:hypothetical protein
MTISHTKPAQRKLWRVLCLSVEFANSFFPQELQRMMSQFEAQAIPAHLVIAAIACRFDCSPKAAN